MTETEQSLASDGTPIDSGPSETWVPPELRNYLENRAAAEAIRARVEAEWGGPPQIINPQLKGAKLSPEDLSRAVVFLKDLISTSADPDGPAVGLLDLRPQADGQPPKNPLVTLFKLLSSK